VIRTWHGERQAQRFGEAITSIQDLDEDGRNDIAIADDADKVHIYSTSSGGLIREIDARRDLGSGGIKVLGFSDVDEDGTPDLLVGQPGQSSGGIGSTIGVGRVATYSARNGSLIWEVMGQLHEGLLGVSIAKLDDIDGDAVNDLAVGESHGWGFTGTHEPGTVYILSGKNGRELRQLGNDPSLPYFGYRMANVGDLDGDGHPELAISSPGYGLGVYRDIGGVGIYSMRTFELLRFFKGVDGPKGLFLGDQLGIEISSAGDADGDGVPDLLLGTSRFGSDPGRAEWGRVELRSGKTGKLLAGYEGKQESDDFVSSLAPLGDIDGDGRSEFLIGSLRYPPPEGFGRAAVVKYRPELPKFLRGDANQDGRVNIADMVFIFSVIYAGQDPGSCPLSLDVDGDNRLDFLDAFTIFFYVFRDGYAPASPFPECSRYGGFQPPNFDCSSFECRE
jgi:FG-GAP repeat protein/dockerin type I repeat protein